MIQKMSRGDRMKPQLVLLHGWAVNSLIWNSILDRLESEFDVTLIDLPGYGTDTDYFEDYSLETVAEVVLSRAPEKANWVAWSLGGTIALSAALAHPERFEKMQLISATPRFMYGEDWEQGAKLPLFKQMADDFAKDYPSALRKFLLLAILSRDRAKAMKLTREVRDLTKTMGQHKPPVDRTIQEGLNILRTTDLRDRLGELTIETQVIAGDNDHIVDSKSSRYLFDQIPNGHSFHLFETGHMPFLHSPDRYIEALVDFIKPK